MNRFTCSLPDHKVPTSSPIGLFNPSLLRPLPRPMDSWGGPPAPYRSSRTPQASFSRSSISPRVKTSFCPPLRGLPPSTGPESSPRPSFEFYPLGLFLRTSSRVHLQYQSRTRVIRAPDLGRAPGPETPTTTTCPLTLSSETWRNYKTITPDRKTSHLVL